MSGIKNFQVGRNKQTRKNNIFEKGNNKRKESRKTNRLMDGVDVWTSYYRANPQFFVRDYLGVELKIFQQILLFVMMHFHFLTYIAARGK